MTVTEKDDVITFGKALIHKEHPGNPLVTIVGQYIGLIIASMANGHYLYSEGMEPPELLGYDSCLVAYLPDLPYQEGVHISPIHEEGPKSTELVEYKSDNSASMDHHVYMVDVGGGADGHRLNECLQDISRNELLADARAEEETQRAAWRQKNAERLWQNCLN